MNNRVDLFLAGGSPIAQDRVLGSMGKSDRVYVKPILTLSDMDLKVISDC